MPLPALEKRSQGSDDPSPREAERTCFSRYFDRWTLPMSAQIASAGFTALAALAALLTVRQARHETRVARDALEAETQPIVTHVPRGLFTQEVEWHNPDGIISMKRRDRSELSVGMFGPEPIFERQRSSAQRPERACTNR